MTSPEHPNTQSLGVKRNSIGDSKGAARDVGGKSGEWSVPKANCKLRNEKEVIDYAKGYR